MSDISSVEGTPDDFQSGGAGDLQKYLEFGLTAASPASLSSTLAEMPATLDVFPQTVSSDNYLGIESLGPGHQSI